MDKEAKQIPEVILNIRAFSFIVWNWKDMRDILHDGDLFINSTIDEIEDVVNGIVCTAEGEIQKINENFAQINYISYKK